MIRFVIRLLSLIPLCAVCLLPATVSAQTARDARVQVTVVDPSGLVVPEATVTLVGIEPSTQTIVLAPAKTTD